MIMEQIIDHSLPTKTQLYAPPGNHQGYIVFDKYSQAIQSQKVYRFYEKAVEAAAQKGLAVGRNVDFWPWKYLHLAAQP